MSVIMVGVLDKARREVDRWESPGTERSWSTLKEFSIWATKKFYKHDPNYEDFCWCAMDITDGLSPTWCLAQPNTSFESLLEHHRVIVISCRKAPDSNGKRKTYWFMVKDVRRPCCIQ